MTEIRDAARPPRTLTLVVLVVGMLTPLLVSIVHALVASEHDLVVLTVGLVAMWVLAVAVYVLLREGTTSGVLPRLRLTWADAGIAVGVGVVGALLVPVLTLGVTSLLGETNLVSSTGQVPALLLAASILTAAVTEEVLYRAAPMGLLLARSSPRWLVFLLPWAVFVVAHLGSWSLAHVVGVVVPLGALLTALYLWRRNLLVNIVAHFIIDAPLLVIALTAPPSA